ncbi:MAG: carboxypeptidase-like regulatory domain-containing protein, partial [Planctomycetes bacterium]|nr:carboxypeptidase-like regulatory domain-containing protein [Planctomycetota bacterium]
SIVPGKRTVVEVFRSDFKDLQSLSSEITLHGRLLKSDRSPMPGMVISLRGFTGKGLTSEPTDQEGRFTLQGIIPGIWSVQCYSQKPDASTTAQWMNGFSDQALIILSLGKIAIPENASDPFPLDLVFEGSAFIGTLCNKATGLPIKACNVPYTVLVFDENMSVEKGRYVGFHGGRFKMEGFADGTFRILCHTPGFLPFRSEPFSLERNQSLDLGKLLLEPTGIIELEALSPSGEVLRPSLSIDGKPFGGTNADHMRLPNGKHLYWQLPTGQITLTIDAYQYVTKEVPVFLEPGEAKPVQVVLSPEQFQN